MGFSLLAPLFLAGLAAIAVPILVHLSARDRRDVVRFPSLKFLTRLPYRQARRQRLRHRRLFALRALALTLLVLAFTRPLFEGASVTAAGGGREVVIVLDRSYSMAYGDAWQRAREAVRDAITAAPAGSRLSLVSFAEEAEVEVAPSSDPQAVLTALEDLKPGSGKTRFAPALRLADEILLDSPLNDRQVVLVSDLQAAGWNRSSDDATVLAPGVELVTRDLGFRGESGGANILISDAIVQPARDDDGTKLTVVARLANRGTETVPDLPVSLTVGAGAEANRIEASVDLPPGQATPVRLGPVAMPDRVTRATVTITGDPLTADNVFHLALRPRAALPVLLIEAPDARPDASLYLRQALTVADATAGETSGSGAGAAPPSRPIFDLTVKQATSVNTADIDTARVVVLHDSPWPTGVASRTLIDHVTSGGGLWVILGSRSQLPDDDSTALLPGQWRESVDRLKSRGVSLTGVDYRHPIFEIFAGPGDGNLAAPRLYRYRPIDLGDGATALARTTDGAVALAERRVGKGRVLLWGSTFDNRWSDLPIQAVFLPFVHQVCRHLAGERTLEPWHRVGQTLDLRALTAAAGVEDPNTENIATVEAPSGDRREVTLDAGLPLHESGFYRVTLPDHGDAQPWPVAVNVDPAESDLARLDAEAFVAASTTQAADWLAGAPLASLSREQQERRQGVWWFLLLAALLLLTTESLWSNRLAGTGESG